jgi:hypothetical protein
MWYVKSLFVHLTVSNSARIDLVNTAPQLPLSPYILANEGIKKGVQEAISMAENAFNVMRDHSGDGRVREMLKLAIGEGEHYQTNFERIKSKRVSSLWS